MKQQIRNNSSTTLECSMRMIFYCFKLKEGADLDDLLAEMDEELPSDKEGEEEEEEDEEDYGLTEVQKRSRHGPFGEQVS